MNKFSQSYHTVKNPIKVCMVAHTFYEGDGCVRRYAETLVKQGDYVDVIALRRICFSNYDKRNQITDPAKLKELLKKGIQIKEIDRLGFIC